MNSENVQIFKKAVHVSFNNTSSLHCLFLVEKADDIVGKIACEVSEYSVHIRWIEPKAPNGMIILYEVHYKRLGDTEVRILHAM